MNHRKGHTLITADNKAYCLECNLMKPKFESMFSYATKEELNNKELEVMGNIDRLEEQKRYDELDHQYELLFSIRNNKL